MSRKVFQKALKHIESRSYDDNISRLNNELKKTGMLSERMTTSTVLIPTETQPYIPPTFSDVPDSNGLMGDNFQQPTYGGDESDSSTWDTGWSSNAYFKNSNDVGGETDRPILIQPDAPYPYDDGGGGSGLVFGTIAFGTSVGVIDSSGKYRQILIGGLAGGTDIPTEESRGAFGAYRALSDEEFNYAVAVWNVYSQLYGTDLGTGIIKAWKEYNRFHDYQSGGEFEDWTITPKRTVGDSRQILVNFQYFKKSNTYISDPGQPRTTVLNRLEDPDSPEFYPGDFSNYLAKLLNLGKRGYDYLTGLVGGGGDLGGQGSDDGGGDLGGQGSNQVNQGGQGSNQVNQGGQGSNQSNQGGQGSNQVNQGGQGSNQSNPRQQPTDVDRSEDLNDVAEYAAYLARKAIAGTLTDQEQKQLETYSSDDSWVKNAVEFAYNDINNLMNKPPGTLTPQEEKRLLDAGKDDFVDGGMKSTDIFGELATVGASAAIVKGGLAIASNAIVKGIVDFSRHAAGTYGTAKTAEMMSDVITNKIPGLVGNANNAGDYNTQLATKLPISILTGTPQEIKLSDKAKRDQINNVSETQFEKALQFGRASAPSANSTVNPPQNPTTGEPLKRPILTKTSGWGAQGGSEVHYDPKTDTLTITSEKMLRTGLKGDEFDSSGKQTRFGDIPDADPEFVENRTREILNIPGVVDVGAFLGSPEYVKMKKNPAYQKEVIERVGRMANDLASFGVQGVASNVVAFRKALTNAGLLPQSEVEKTGGGYGQVFSQTSYKGNEIPSELRNIINNKIGVKESFFISEGWQSPDHANVERNVKTRWFNPNAGTDSAKWFDPKEVKPPYPVKAPPEMIDGYSVKSNLAPKFVEKGPIIKLTKKDLLRNHRLKDSEVKEMMETINRLNEFLAKHPEELIYAQSRYPKNDPRLAELNWKQDEMRRANDEYVERQFPINKTVFKRTQEAIKRNIELTDPKSFKVTSTPIRHQDVVEKKVKSVKKYMKSEKDLKKIDEYKERAAQNLSDKFKKLKELQEVKVERKQIEEAAKPFKSDWKIELSEKMSTSGMTRAVFDAEGDVALVTLSNTTISDSDNIVPYEDYGDPDYAITSQRQSLGRIDTSKYDTLKLTISGSFNTRTVDGSSLTDTVSIGVKINGTYGGNYLAQGLGAGTHVISIPKRFQKSNIRFDALKVHAIQGVSTPTSITNIQLQRRNPMNVFVSLDDPDAIPFIRGNLGGDEERRKKLKDQLEAGNEWMDYLGLERSKTSPGDIELAHDALNLPGGVQGSLDKNYQYDPHMKTWVPNISDVERRAAGRQSRFRIDNPSK